MQKNSFYLVAIAGLLLVMLLGSFGMASVSAAPQAAPTPNAATERNSNAPQLVTWMDGSAITADTTSTCFEVTFWEIADLYYSIDQGADIPNTTTLSLQFGNDTTNLVSGIDIVASNSADASGLQPFAMFGRFACVYANVSNTNTITITVNGLLK